MNEIKIKKEEMHFVNKTSMLKKNHSCMHHIEDDDDDDDEEKMIKLL